jgi:DNA-directed RNA polymerase specialized sigma24 family protein
MNNNYLEREDLLREIIKIQTDPNADKTEFATQCMLIIKNLRKRPQFSGYSNNWAEDYVSNSIYKMLKYIHNFDHTRISKITGDPVSPFAYLTQIAKAAFIEVIVKRKNEESHIKETFQYHELEDLIQNAYNNVENKSTLSNHDSRVEHFNLRKLEIDGIRFTTIYDMLKYFKDNGRERLFIEYPKKYSIDLEEYAKINSLGVFEYLNLVKKSYKQKKKEPEPEPTPEELEIITDIDTWGEDIEKLDDFCMDEYGVDIKDDEIGTK